MQASILEFRFDPIDHRVLETNYLVTDGVFRVVRMSTSRLEQSQIVSCDRPTAMPCEREINDWCHCVECRWAEITHHVLRHGRLKRIFGLLGSFLKYLKARGKAK